MSLAKELRALAKRHPSLSLVGQRLLVETPLNHVVRGINLDASRWTKGLRSAQAFFFVPARPFPAITLGSSLRLGSFNVDEPVERDALIRAIEADGLPFLQQCSGPAGALDLFVKLHPDECEWKARSWEEYAYMLAVAERYPEAFAALDRLKELAEQDREPLRREWLLDMTAQADRLRESIGTGPDAARELLAENERASLAACGLSGVYPDPALC